ncbi:unnamed protein product [Cylindrotheca closterium]|uniref:Uncharacterized protein n=1 Tax=Cylindrotheca closterium TaxID=2856 RepID=A0AAD2FX04_9STRA|nr:unnamed protein product [Cylindrotheca closterium]
MAKLITNHDPYHIHKILGVSVLLHYLYRFALLFQYGTAFPAFESPQRAAAGVFLHAMLSWSSLLLPLPIKRNFTKPMIWPEFRLHSIAFASRHIVTTIVTLLDWWPNEEASILAHALARGLVLCGTVKAASFITDKWGNREQRTTNSMPYPSTVDPETERPVIKKQYMLSQFAATASCLLPDATLNFAPLLAIQMAPLMMTLVRKGKVTSFDYHRVYAISLYLGYVMVFFRLLYPADSILTKSVGLKTIFIISFPSSKLRRLMPAIYVWAINTLLSTIIYPLVLQNAIDSMMYNDHAARLLFWFVAVGCTWRQVFTYAPLFGYSIRFRRMGSSSNKPNGATKTVD